MSYNKQWSPTDLTEVEMLHLFTIFKLLINSGENIDNSRKESMIIIVFSYQTKTGPLDSSTCAQNHSTPVNVPSINSQHENNQIIVFEGK